MLITRCCSEVPLNQKHAKLNNLGVFEHIAGNLSYLSGLECVVFAKKSLRGIKRKDPVFTPHSQSVTVSLN